MRRISTWIVAALGVVVVLILLGVGVHNWRLIGSSGISVNGWIALVLGVMATLGLGIGLMALVFISNRRGYDEPPREDR